MSLRKADELMRQTVIDAEVIAPEECVPSGPDMVVPQLVHRGHDGWVNITRKQGNVWHDLGNIKARDMHGLFADQAFQEAIDQDSYYSLHGMFNHGRRRGRDTHPLLAPRLRNIESIRWLTCCHVDLDCYKRGINKHDAYAGVMKLVDKGVLPAPSIFTLSRGVWAIWLLRDRHKAEQPLRCYPHHTVYDWWQRIQNTLYEACCDLGPDPATKHGATVTRIPGTINTKAKFARVGYMIPADIHGNVYRYTLQELDDFLKPIAKKSVIVQGRIGPANPIKQRGWHGRWFKLLKRLERLRNHRRGWKAGTRSNAVLYVATALKGVRAEKREAFNVLCEHIDSMEQPDRDRFTINDAMGSWAKASFKHPINNQTVADALKVTPDEAALLSDSKSQFPPALEHRGVLPLDLGKATRKERSTHRRERIVELWNIQLSHQGQPPSGATIRQLLEGEGISAAPRTIMKDLRALGLKSDPPADRQLKLPQEPDA